MNFFHHFWYMRGFCARCKEFRSENGTDAYPIRWKSGVAVCGKCGGYVDWQANNKKNSNGKTR